MIFKRYIIGGVFIAIIALFLTLGVADQRRASASDTILELPVSFTVLNTNTSGNECPSNGLQYVVRGHLVGPQSILFGPAPRAITVYVHGHSDSEGNWAFK